MDDSTMLSIRDFAEFTGLNEAKLRYYDKIGLISPHYRGENNYRYYSFKQTIMVDFIKVLIKIGVPLSTILREKKGRTPKSVLSLLIEQHNKLDMRLSELQEAYSLMYTYINNIYTGIDSYENEISLQTLDDIPINLGEAVDYDRSNSIYEPFIQFCNLASQNRINLLYPVGGYFEDFYTFLNAPAQPTRLFSQDPNGNGIRKAGQYLVAYSKGYYGSYGDLPQKMVAYAMADSLNFKGPLYITYLLDEISTDDESQFLSQIVVGVSMNKSA
jgi:DNA-binding transcriptional MerR regulator